MDRFPSSSLLAFLRLIDEELAGRADILVIGGAAIAIAYSGWIHVTADIDVLDVEGSDFWAACDRVRRKTPRSIPISRTTVATTPHEYAERRVRVTGSEFKRLRLHVPERHDLAIMKVARGLDHDLASIAEIHERHPFDLDVLIARYRETVPYLIGVDPKHFTWAFLGLVSRIFGDAGVEAAEAALRKAK